VDPLAALDRSVAEFRARLAAVPADRWGSPSPCEGWTARDVAAHVVGGNRMSVLLLGGATADEARALLRGVDVGDDPVAAYDDGAAEMVAAFREPGAMERTVHHPAGDIPGALFLGFRVGDLVIHAWDLARATGGDERLDPELVDTVWQGMSPLAPVIAQTGLFGPGPSGTLAEEASTQERLLDLAGRRP
jgi:uncharacterized protein (TIGR03086 family)